MRRAIVVCREPAMFNSTLSLPHCLFSRLSIASSIQTTLVDSCRDPALTSLYYKTRITGVHVVAFRIVYQHKVRCEITSPFSYRRKRTCVCLQRGCASNSESHTLPLTTVILLPHCRQGSCSSLSNLNCDARISWQIPTLWRFCQHPSDHNMLCHNLC